MTSRWEEVAARTRRCVTPRAARAPGHMDAAGGLLPGVEGGRPSLVTRSRPAPTGLIPHHRKHAPPRHRSCVHRSAACDPRSWHASSPERRTSVLGDARGHGPCPAAPSRQPMCGGTARGHAVGDSLTPHTGRAVVARPLAVPPGRSPSIPRGDRAHGTAGLRGCRCPTVGVAFALAAHPPVREPVQMRPQQPDPHPTRHRRGPGCARAGHSRRHGGDRSPRHHPRGPPPTQRHPPTARRSSILRSSLSRPAHPPLARMGGVDTASPVEPTSADTGVEPTATAIGR